MKRPALLDSSYLIDLERETANSEIGPARRFLSSLRGRPLVVSVVSVQELLEDAISEASRLIAAVYDSTTPPRAGATVRVVSATDVPAARRE